MARSTALARREEPAPLTPEQAQAAGLVALGRRSGEVVQAVGITPGELAQWRRMPAFVAAVNAQLADAQESTRQRLRGLAGDALDVVEAALTEAATPGEIRLKLAVKVLELVGAGDLAKREIGSADPVEVEADQRRAAFHKALMND
jgi:hypothetical protein